MIIAQFPIILLRLKAPPFLLHFLRGIVWNREVTLYYRYLGNDKGSGLLEV